jgi:uncharacterized protein YjbJ (UPF0337 family)
MIPGRPRAFDAEYRSVGHLTDDHNLEAEAIGQKVAAKVQKKVGE